MKKFIIKKNIFIIIPLIFIFCFLLASTFIKTKYEITSPGHITEVENVINIENSFDSMGSFNTTSVYVYEKCTFLQYLLAHLSKAMIIEPVSEIVDGTSVKNSKSGQIQKKNSINNSIICAYRKANLTLDYTYSGVIIHTLAIESTDDLEVGDVISEVCGTKFDTMAEFYNLFNEARLNSECYDSENETYSISLTVNGVEKTVSTKYTSMVNNLLYPVFGFYIYDQYEINFESANPKFVINETNTGGPSGGLMQTLSVYDSLTENDLTNGLKIAGTGTISIDGTVGAIGGMYSKIFTAYYDDCDIFFVPYYENDGFETNYQEAMRAYEALGSPEDFVIVPVSTFDEAVDYLESLGDNNA